MGPLEEGDVPTSKGAAARGELEEEESSFTPNLPAWHLGQWLKHGSGVKCSGEKPWWRWAASPGQSTVCLGLAPGGRGVALVGAEMAPGWPQAPRWGRRIQKLLWAPLRTLSPCHPQQDPDPRCSTSPGEPCSALPGRFPAAGLEGEGVSGALKINCLRVRPIPVVVSSTKGGQRDAAGQMLCA